MALPQHTSTRVCTKHLHPFNTMLLSPGYNFTFVYTCTTICTPSDTHPHIPTHKQAHTPTQAHTQSESCYVIEEPFVLCGREALQDIRSVAIFLLSGRFCKWVRRRLMLLGDSAGLSLSCWNLHTHREYHSTNTSLQFPYHNCT